MEKEYTINIIDPSLAEDEKIIKSHCYKGSRYGVKLRARELLRGDTDLRAEIVERIVKVI